MKTLINLIPLFDGFLFKMRHVDFHVDLLISF